jgi:hypothetical protein
MAVPIKVTLGRFNRYEIDKKDQLYHMEATGMVGTDRVQLKMILGYQPCPNVSKTGDAVFDGLLSHRRKSARRQPD